SWFRNCLLSSRPCSSAEVCSCDWGRCEGQTATYVRRVPSEEVFGSFSPAANGSATTAIIKSCCPIRLTYVNVPTHARVGMDATRATIAHKANRLRLLRT